MGGEGEFAVAPGAGDLDESEVALFGDEGSWDTGRIVLLIWSSTSARTEGTGCVFHPGIGCAGPLNFEEFGVVPISGKEHDAGNVILGNEVKQFFLFGGELSKGFKKDEGVDHLTAARDDFEGFVAVDQRLLEPFKLAFPEHGFCRATREVVWGAVVSIIEHEEFDVAPFESGEDAFGFGGAIDDLRPILFVKLETDFFESEASI